MRLFFTNFHTLSILKWTFNSYAVVEKEQEEKEERKENPYSFLSITAQSLNIYQYIQSLNEQRLYNQYIGESTCLVREYLCSIIG